jgi:hypothetical protein
VAEITPEYVEKMDDVLATYERPYDPAEPVVCFDEKPVVLRDDAYWTTPSAAPGQIKRRDHEYVRRGTANVFCAVETKAGRRFLRPTKRRAGRDFAKMLGRISRAYPEARKIHLVMDNLSTHTEKSLTDMYGDIRGHRLWRRFEVHYTPKHASWLNQAEIEISRMAREAIGRDRIGSIAALRRRLTPWETKANRDGRGINWTFTRARARKKFNLPPRRFRSSAPPRQSGRSRRPDGLQAALRDS